MAPSETLTAARTIIETRGWHQGSGEGPEGQVCAYRALMMAVGSPNWMENFNAQKPLHEVIQGKSEFAYSITAYNDRHCKTVADVMEWFGKAIEFARKQEGLDIE